jgi:hypothetical protein
LCIVQKIYFVRTTNKTEEVVYSNACCLAMTR